MCCFFAVLVFLGPRVAILFWWIFDSDRWELAYNSFFWPLLGFIFIPWTTLMYTAVAPGGIAWFDWILLAMALFADIVSLSGQWRSRGYRTA